MKRKVLPLALVLAMCLDLTIPAMAATLPAVPSASGKGEYTVSISAEDTSAIDLGAKSFQVRNWSYDEETCTNTKTAAETLTLNRVFALPQGAELVIENKDGHIDDMVMLCQAWSDPDGDGVYESQITKAVLNWVWEPETTLSVDVGLLPIDTAGPLTDTYVEGDNTEVDTCYSSSWHVSCTGDIYYHTEGYGGGIDGSTAISADYLIQDFGANTLFKLSFEGYDYDTGKSVYDDYYFFIPAEQPAAPVVTEENTPAGGTAYASAQTVAVDGTPVEFQMYALKDADGNSTNYIKLRDLASVLNGTAAQFEVGWDGAVNILAGQPYTPNGSEMSTPFSGDRSYELSSSETLVNGQAVSLEAIVLKDDAGDGYTYYKLRDLGEALGFNVSWSAELGVFIETDKPYSGQ